MKDIEHVEMSGMSGSFMLQSRGEILNKPVGWLTTTSSPGSSRSPATAILESEKTLGTRLGLQPTQPCQTIQPIKEHVTGGAC